MLSFSTTLLRILFIANLCLTGTYLNAMDQEEEAPYKQEVFDLCIQIQNHSDLPKEISLIVVGFSDCIAGEDVRTREENQYLRKQVRKAINGTSTLPELLTALPNKCLKFRHKANKRRADNTVQRNTKNKRTKRNLFDASDAEENNNVEDEAAVQPTRLLNLFNALEDDQD